MLKVEYSNLVDSSILGYAKGFKKALRQAIFFSSNSSPENFNLDKDVVDGRLVNE